MKPHWAERKGRSFVFFSKTKQPVEKPAFEANQQPDRDRSIFHPPSKHNGTEQNLQVRTFYFYNNHVILKATADSGQCLSTGRGWSPGCLFGGRVKRLFVTELPLTWSPLCRIGSCQSVSGRRRYQALGWGGNKVSRCRKGHSLNMVGILNGPRRCDALVDSQSYNMCCHSHTKLKDAVLLTDTHLNTLSSYVLTSGSVRPTYSWNFKNSVASEISGLRKS